MFGGVDASDERERNSVADFAAGFYNQRTSSAPTSSSSVSSSSSSSSSSSNQKEATTVFRGARSGGNKSHVNYEGGSPGDSDEDDVLVNDLEDDLDVVCLTDKDCRSFLMHYMLVQGPPSLREQLERILLAPAVDYSAGWSANATVAETVHFGIDIDIHLLANNSMATFAGVRTGAITTNSNCSSSGYNGIEMVGANIHGSGMAGESLCHHLQHDPLRVIAIARDAAVLAQQRVRDEAALLPAPVLQMLEPQSNVARLARGEGSVKRSVTVHFHGLPETIEESRSKVSSVRSCDVGKFMQLHGTVIRMGKSKMVQRRIWLQCQNRRCGHCFPIDSSLTENWKMKPPKQVRYSGPRQGSVCLADPP